MIYSICRSGQKQLPFLKKSRTRIENTNGKNENGEIGVFGIVKIPNDEQFIGFEHNRRYFSDDEGETLPLSEKQLQEKLKDHKIVCGEYRFGGSHNGDLGVQIKNLLFPYTQQFIDRALKYYPDMKTSIDFVLNNNFLFPHNMFYTSVENFKEIQTFIKKVFLDVRDVWCPDSTPDHHKGKMKAMFSETMLTAFYIYKFGINNIAINNITLFDREFKEIVDPITGINHPDPKRNK